MNNIAKTAGSVVKENAQQTLGTVKKIPGAVANVVGKVFPLSKAMNTEQSMRNQASSNAQASVQAATPTPISAPTFTKPKKPKGY